MKNNLLNKEPKQRNKSTDFKDYMKALNTNKQYLKNISDDLDSSDICDLKLNNIPNSPLMCSSLEKKQLYFKKKESSRRYDYNNIFKEEKIIKPATEKLIKGLISYYLFVYDLNNDIERSKSSIPIYVTKSDFYLINRNWMNKYKRLYFYDELIKEIKQMKSNKNLETIYTQLSSNYFQKIKKNENFCNLETPQKEDIIDNNNIKYPNNIIIINNITFDTIKFCINNNIYLTKVNYLINEGKIIIKYSNYNINELLLVNINSDNFCTEYIFSYFNKEGMESHFDILSKNKYSQIKLYKSFDDKNYLINNFKEQQKIGIFCDITHKREDVNFIKKKNQIQQNDFSLHYNLLSTYENKNINKKSHEYKNITSQNEISLNKIYKKESIIKGFNCYCIEFDSYSFFTTLPIPNLSCINCSSEIELESIKFNDEKEDDIIIFNCLGECGKIDTLSIKEYLKQFLSNTYLYKKCYSCEKLQLNDKISIFNYCLECKKIFCIDCYDNIHNDHNFIKINDINNKCMNHLKNDLNCYCYQDKKKLCQKCLNDGSHSNHQRLLVDDISPVDINNDKNKEHSEIEIFKSIMEYYNQKIMDINDKKKKS